MDFELSQEQILLQDTIRRFVAEQCSRDYVRELEQSGAFPEALWQKLAEIGLLGLPVPEEYGGSGGTMLDMVVVKEFAASGCEFHVTLGKGDGTSGALDRVMTLQSIVR